MQLRFGDLHRFTMSQKIHLVLTRPSNGYFATGTSERVQLLPKGSHSAIAAFGKTISNVQLLLLILQGSAS